MLAMVANDDAGRLDASGVSTTIASMLAPTGAPSSERRRGRVGAGGSDRCVLQTETQLRALVLLQ